MSTEIFRIRMSRCRSSFNLNRSQFASRCFALQSAANRVIRTIVTAIHDKILIPWLAAAAAPLCYQGERSKTAFLNIIRPRAFYYSTGDGSSQEFDLARPENFHRIQRGFVSCSFFVLCSFFLSFFLFLPKGRIRPYRRGSNRQNYVVAPTERGISFLAFRGRSSVLCKDRTILFHVLECTPSLFHLLPIFFFPPCVSFCFSRCLSRSSRDLSFRRCHKFHPSCPPSCSALLLAHIFRYPRTQPCSRNPFRSTPAVTLARPPYTYIANSDIATAMLYRYIRQLYLCTSRKTDGAFSFIIV